jgi:hypothetical protein
MIFTSFRRTIIMDKEKIKKRGGRMPLTGV